MKKVCATIYNARTKKNLTQEYMAEHLCVSQSYYSKLEGGSKKLSLEVAIKIAKILDVDLINLEVTDSTN